MGQLYEFLRENPTGTGWRWDLEKPRRQRLNARTWTQRLNLNRGTYNVPKQFDPECDPSFIQVEDQGQIGSCAGNANTSCGEICNRNESGEYPQFSRMGAYLLAQEKDGLLGSDSGSTIESNLEVAEEGYCFESTFPYPSSYTSRIPSAARRERIYQLPGAMPITDSKTLFDWILTNQGPVYIGMRWTRMMDEQDVIKDFFGPRRNDRHGGGHSVFFYGWTTIADEFCPWLWNSWSRRWGRDGRKPISRSAFDQIFTDNFTRCFGFRWRQKPEVEDWSKLRFI